MCDKNKRARLGGAEQCVIDGLRQLLGDPHYPITLDTNITQLNLDSLDITELVMIIEDAYDIDVNDVVIDEIVDIGLHRTLRQILMRSGVELQ